MIPQTQPETYYCEACEAEVKGYHRFCYNCGEYLGSDGTRISLFNNSSMQSAFTFFIIYLFVCLLVHFTNWFDDYSRLFLVELFLGTLTLLYVWINFKEIKPVLRFRNFNMVRLTGCISLAVIASVLVNIIVSKLNISFFGTDASYYSRYSIYSMPVLVLVYSIALNPAIFEELAFRGVIYNYLNRFL